MLNRSGTAFDRGIEAVGDRERLSFEHLLVARKKRHERDERLRRRRAPRS